MNVVQLYLLWFMKYLIKHMLLSCVLNYRLICILEITLYICLISHCWWCWVIVNVIFCNLIKMYCVTIVIFIIYWIVRILGDILGRVSYRRWIKMCYVMLYLYLFAAYLIYMRLKCWPAPANCARFINSCKCRQHVTLLLHFVFSTNTQDLSLQALLRETFIVFLPPTQWCASFWSLIAHFAYLITYTNGSNVHGLTWTCGSSLQMSIAL